MHTQADERRPCEDRGRDCSAAATSPEMSGHQRIKVARKDSSLELSEGAWPC